MFAPHIVNECSAESGCFQFRCKRGCIRQVFEFAYAHAQERIRRHGDDARAREAGFLELPNGFARARDLTERTDLDGEACECGCGCG